MVLNVLVSTFLEIITPFASIGTGVLAALLTSSRARTLAKDQQDNEERRREVDWARQRQTFLDEQNKEREMFVAKVEAEARTEARGRAHQHAEDLIAPLGELRELLQKAPRGRPGDAANLKRRCYQIFEKMKVDVAYQDADLRDRFDILFCVYDANDSDTYPYVRRYDMRYLLKYVGAATLESLMARLRGENVPALTREQILVKDLCREIGQFEEVEIKREIAEGEAQFAAEESVRKE